MMTSRTHFPLTTAAQRRLLFETWEATGDVSFACRTAHVGRGTFYYWKPRFEAEGYVGLEAFASRAPKKTTRVAAEIEQRVLALQHAQPEWGKRRLADELAKQNNWVPLVSPNTVKRILRDAGLWTEPGAREKKRGRKVAPAPPKSQDKR